MLTNLRISKRICFRLAQESHLTATGCEQQAEHPTDRPAEQQQSDLFCELVNIAQRLNRQKIHVTPPTHQHAIASVTIVQMSQDQKKL
jgi:hypothetical protein